MRPSPKRKKNRVMFFLLSAILVDLISMNFYALFPIQEQRDYFYFCTQSLSTLLYILTIVAATTDLFFVNLLSGAWSGLAMNDLFDNLFNDNTSPNTSEYVFAVLVSVWVAYKIYYYYHPEIIRVLKFKIRRKIRA